MQIDPKNSLQVEPANRLQQKQHSTEPQQPAATTAKAEQPVSQVSAFSHSLEQAYQTLAQHDSVDMDKVKQLQLAIANGELKLDEEALVNAMLEMHKR
jgi:negative regulator of flagellin synthesis FlgM